MKIGRHAKIVDLIGKYDIETQEELAEQLKREGDRVTQATISRDIRELKLTKIATNDGRQKYALMQPQPAGMNEKYLRVLKDGFLSMDMAQNILVIKTVSGMAMAVAAAIDAMHWSEVAGCIAAVDLTLLVGKEEYLIESLLDRGDTARVFAGDDIHELLRKIQILLCDDRSVLDDIDRDAVVYAAKHVQIQLVDRAFDLDDVLFPHLVAVRIFDDRHAAVHLVELQIFVD